MPISWRRCTGPAVVKPGDLAIQCPERGTPTRHNDGSSVAAATGRGTKPQEMQRQRDLYLRVRFEAPICIEALALAIRCFWELERAGTEIWWKFELSASWFSGIGHTTGCFFFFVVRFCFVLFCLLDHVDWMIVSNEMWLCVC